MKKGENDYPLSLSGWVNYLMQEQSTNHFKFYNEVLYKFTIMIVLLTILNFLLIIGTSSSNFPVINTDIKNGIFLIAVGLIVIVIISMVWVILIKLRASKNYVECVTKSEAIIINSIIKGEETDIECILKRYSNIWEICKKK